MTGTSASLPVSWIETTGRIRSIDPDQVQAIRSSIRDIGLLNPVIVHATGNRQYRLVAGMHRLEACKAEGYAEIDAIVMDLTKLEAVIAECDENLCGPKLTASEKALFTDRRRKAYEEIHGPAKAVGGYASASSQGRDVASANLAVASFTADTAAKTGLSERAVRRDAERGDRVIPEVLQMLKGTRLDSGAYLDKIKNFPPNEQVQAARRDLAFDHKSTSSETVSVIDQKPLPTYEEMRAAIYLLTALQATDYLALCPPNKRVAMCQRLAHLSQTIDQVREAATA